MSVASDFSMFDLLGSEFDDDLTQFNFDDVCTQPPYERRGSIDRTDAVELGVERRVAGGGRDTESNAGRSGDDEEVASHDPIDGPPTGISIPSIGEKRSRVQESGSNGGGSVATSTSGRGGEDGRDTCGDSISDDVSDAGDETIGTVSTGNGTQRKWIVTIVGTEQVGDRVALSPALLGIENRVKCWSSQYEEGEGGLKHAHVFVQWQNTVRFSWMNTAFKKMFEDIEGFSFNGFSLKYVKGTKQDTIRAWNYCCKTRTRDCGEELVVKYNEPTSAHKNKRAKKSSQAELMFKLLREDYGAKYSWDEIYEAVSREDKILMFANETKFRRIHTLWVAEQIRLAGRTIKSVHVLFGASRAGKTVYASSNLFPEDCRDSIYKTTADNFKNWGSYRGEKCVLIDEFYGQIKLSEFLSMTDLDKRAPAMNVKYGDVQFNYEHIVFTSNKHPSLWYKNALQEPTRYDSFRYRLTNVLYYPRNHSDGTPNTYALHEADVEKEEYTMPDVYNREDVNIMMGLSVVSEYAPGMNYEDARNEL